VIPPPSPVASPPAPWEIVSPLTVVGPVVTVNTVDTSSPETSTRAAPPPAIATDFATVNDPEERV
jgi:hypothetical protein